LVTPFDLISFQRLNIKKILIEIESNDELEGQNGREDRRKLTTRVTWLRWGVMYQVRRRCRKELQRARNSLVCGVKTRQPSHLLTFPHSFLYKATLEYVQQYAYSFIIYPVLHLTQLLILDPFLLASRHELA
jgi:hypothetical protein